MAASSLTETVSSGTLPVDWVSLAIQVLPRLAESLFGFLQTRSNSREDVERVRRETQEAVAQMRRESEANMSRAQAEALEKLKEQEKALTSRLQQAFQKEIASLKANNEGERQAMEASVRRRAEQNLETMRSSLQHSRRQLDEKAAEQRRLLADHMQQIERAREDTLREVEMLRDRLKQEVHDRVAKIEQVNALRLRIRVLDKLAVIGQKGTGKSTFLWLSGETAEKPHPAAGDGTKRTVVSADSRFIDTIGTLGTDLSSFLRLLVLMINQGFPRDLILFTNNDRIMSPLTTMQTLGLHNPLIVCLKSSVWETLNRAISQPESRRNRLRIITEPRTAAPLASDLPVGTSEGRAFRRLLPLESILSDDDPADVAGLPAEVGPGPDSFDPLEEIYHLQHYRAFREHQVVGRPITHHDDLTRPEFAQRANPLSSFIARLPVDAHGHLRIPTAEPLDPIIETLWRLIYIYHHRYARSGGDPELRFINERSISLDL